jgi:hypothetical protein
MASTAHPSPRLDLLHVHPGYAQSKRLMVDPSLKKDGVVLACSGEDYLVSELLVVGEKSEGQAWWRLRFLGM